MNRYTVDEEQQFDYLRIKPKIETEQASRLKKIRKGRDKELVNQTLDALKTGAEGNDNLVPLIIDAVRAYATLGEICGVLREVFGEYKASDIL